MPTMTGERARPALRSAALALALAGAAAAGPALAAEATLTAKVDRTEIAVDEELTLQVRLEASEAPTRYDLPEPPDFRVVARAPSQERTVSLGGGAGVQIRQAFTITERLAPRRTGTLTLPPVTAVVRGNEYTTQPIAITVTPAGSAPANPPAAEPAPPGGRRGSYRGWEKDVALEVQLDRREAYVGEQVVASIWLYSPLGVVNYDRFAPPRYDGFWREDLETPATLQRQVRTIDGVPTLVYLLQRVALFPTRAGDLTLPAAEIHLSVRLGSGGPFDLFGEVQQVERRSAPVTLKVKPLPPGAPAGFESVNVGTLSLDAVASPAHAVAGEPVTVRVSASGDGNVRALSLPVLAPIAGAKAFQPTATDRAGVRSGRFGGTRTVETVLLPERTGELVIPSVAWPYFDPRTGRYEQAHTPEMHVVVGAAVAGATATPGANALAAGLRPLRAEADLSRRLPPAWARAGFAALLLLPPLGFLGLVLAERVRTRAGSARRRADRAAHRRLSAARRRLARGDRAGFLAEVEHALLGYASDRLGHPAAGLTREALGAALARAGAHPPAVRALSAALDAGDLARYGGEAGRDDDVLAAAERALGVLEEADWQPEREEGA